MKICVLSMYQALNSNTKFSLFHKLPRLRFDVDNVLTGTIWDEMHFVNIGEIGLNLL